MRQPFSVHPAAVARLRLLCLLVCLAWPAPVAGLRSDATTLFGIEGFRVVIAALSPPARRLGLSETQLHTLAVTHLRRNALTSGDFPAVLDISLRVVEHPAAVLAYSLELQVHQVVHLKRTEQVHLMAPTWTEGTLTMVPRAGLRRSVDSALAELCDSLGRDYRLVNS
jgi:hypothetical protein